MFKKILLSLLLLTSSACQEKSQEPVLKIAVSPDYPPFEFKKSGEAVGFDIDLAKAVATKLGKKLEVIELDFSSLIPALRSGKADFIMSGITVTPEREANVDFSEVYYRASVAGLALHSEGINDLSGKKIGAQLGSFMELFAKEQQKILPGIEVIALVNNMHLLQELKLGRIDILLLEEAQIPVFLKSNPELASVIFPKAASGYAIGFKKGSPLKSEFNQALKELRADGSLDKFESTWLKN